MTTRHLTSLSKSKLRPSAGDSEVDGYDKAVEATNGERRAAHDALDLARRLLLVVVAGILVIVGAMTADHIETIGAPINQSSATAIDVVDPSDVTTEVSTLTAGAASESNEWSAGHLVLLTCSIVALLVLLVHLFRARPRAGSLQRRMHEHTAHLLRALVPLDSAGPDRLALCVIRT